MRTISLLLLVSVSAALESHDRSHSVSRRAKRELLLRSKRRWVLSTIEIVEEDPGPYPKEISKMFNTKTNGIQANHMYRIRGMGVNEEPLGVFSIDKESGVVFANKPVDREEWAFFHIKFDVLDKMTGKEIDRELAFDVEIHDINDNAPTFLQPQMEAEVKENSQEGYLPLRIQVKDQDKENSQNSTITLSVFSQSPQVPKIDVSQINNNVAQLTLKGCFDYDKVKKYEIILHAKDHGKPSLTSTAVATLNIIDSNTHLPTFKERTYQGELLEMITSENVLRLAVEDKDTPKTPAWRAEYFIITGNEENNYEIETDPETNEGILKVIKGKDFERTTFNTLRIGVKNEEPLFVCESNAPPFDSVNVTIKVIDVNDPPHFEKDVMKLYIKEEEKPGKMLLIPKVYDDDSDISKIRYTILEDPHDLVTIDEKTGEVTTIKKMDRESPSVHENIYKIVIGAIDNGEPPATGTGTILVELQDINDNVPELVNNNIIMCGNKVNRVMVPAKDSDAHPYSGPFIFSLGNDDDVTLKQRWKLDPATGEEAGLVSLKTLAYGNYSVPLLIQDQQGTIGRATAKVMVCDCEGRDVCRSKHPLLASMGAASIGLIIAALLLFLLLLILLVCECGRKQIKFMPAQQDEGIQTLTCYNQEGGSSECKTHPILLPKVGVDVDGVKLGFMKMCQTAPAVTQKMDSYNSLGQFTMNGNMTAMRRQSEGEKLMSDHRMHPDIVFGSMWRSDQAGTYQGRSTWSQFSSLKSNHQLEDHINRRLHMINGTHVDHPVYQPYTYTYEGQGSKSQSLDELSFNSLEDFQFLNDLEPRFKSLGTICHQTIREKQQT
ncbi:cadherin-like protein 26 [Aulostomus maculatus]